MYGRITFKEVKKELEREIISGILDYLRNGSIPNNNSNKSYMNAYTIIQNWTDIADEESENLFNYHNNIIQGFIEDSYKIIIQEQKHQFIDSFITITEKIYF